MNGTTLDSLIGHLSSRGGAWWLLEREPWVARAGPGAGCEVCTLDPSSLCCLCPGGSTAKLAPGRQRLGLRLGRDWRDSFPNLENVYLLISQRGRKTPEVPPLHAPLN